MADMTTSMLVKTSTKSFLGPNKSVVMIFTPRSSKVFRIGLSSEDLRVNAVISYSSSVMGDAILEGLAYEVQ